VDKDGVYDKALFLPTSSLPAGAVWLKGSLYVAAPPVCGGSRTPMAMASPRSAKEVVRG
jgi:hypothetical protein